MIHQILKSKSSRLFLILGGFFVANAIVAYAPNPEPEAIPTEVTMRQARLAVRRIDGSGGAGDIRWRIGSRLDLLGVEGRRAVGQRRGVPRWEAGSRSRCRLGRSGTHRSLHGRQPAGGLQHDEGHRGDGRGGRGPVEGRRS